MGLALFGDKLKCWVHLQNEHTAKLEKKKGNTGNNPSVGNWELFKWSMSFLDNKIPSYHQKLFVKECLIIQKNHLKLRKHISNRMEIISKGKRK